MLACSVPLLGACGDPLFLMHEEHVVEDGEERYIGGGCQDVSASVTSGTGTAGEGPGYAIEMTGSDDGVIVVVRDEKGVTLEERSYDEDFLLSGEVDSFELRRDGVAFGRLRFWGGTTCESPREPE